ncbi:MAG: hypothetical protein AAFQ09_12925 [Pseudomonadota bacterium]
MMSDNRLWGLDTSLWFGLCLAALLPFLWCLVSMVEIGAVTVGYMWGVIVFGLISLVAGVIALVAFSSTGGVVKARDRLTAPTGARVPHAGHGRGFATSGYRPSGSGDVPRGASGRALK